MFPTSIPFFSFKSFESHLGQVFWTSRISLFTAVVHFSQTNKVSSPTSESTWNSWENLEKAPPEA